MRRHCTGGVSHFHPCPTSIPTLCCSRSTSTTSGGLRRWPVGKPSLVAFQRAISEDHPGSLSSVAKRANLGYFGDGSGFTVKTKTNQPPALQMVLISHNQLRKDKREHATSNGTEGAIRGGAKSRGQLDAIWGWKWETPPGCAFRRCVESSDRSARRFEKSKCVMCHVAVKLDSGPFAEISEKFILRNRPSTITTITSKGHLN